MIVCATHIRTEFDGNEVYEHEGVEFILDPTGTCLDCSTPALEVSPTGKLHQLLHDRSCPRVPLMLLREGLTSWINEPHGS